MHLAAWYDLNDRRRHFTDVVPIKARESPLLLSAILAFSAASKNGSANEDLVGMAEFYHLQSVQILLRIIQNAQDLVSNEEVLAAICLLRSYEIITRSFPVRLKAKLTKRQRISARRVIFRAATLC